jgi:tetrahydromethanopterin S-methyltransferase subunit H
MLTVEDRDMENAGNSAVVASMFYQGDSLVVDASSGKIDREGAVKRIKKTDRLAKKHGVAYVLDLEIPSVESAKEILTTAAESTDSPLWISSFNEEMRQAATRIAVEEGLQDRVYYSTLNYMSDEDEFRSVADLGVKPVIQVFNPDNPLPDGYLSKTEEFLALADKVGIATEHAVLLPTVLDFGSISLVLSTVDALHDKHGLPVCVPSVGPVYTWAGELSPDARRLLLSAAMTYTLSAGADLLHIGSVKRAFIAFPVVSLFQGFEERRAAFAAP